MNDKEFRQHVAELLARQRNRGQAAKKNPPTPEPPTQPATMWNKEFRQHLKQLVARQHNEGPPLVDKKPPKPEPSKPAAVTEKKPPTTETRKLNVRRKAK